MRVAIQRFGLASAAVALFLLDAKGQSFTEYSLPQPNSFPLAICAGPDGNLWFTERFGHRIGRITTGGIIAEFSLPSSVNGPRDIAAGPDGNLWYTRSDRIGRITPAGVVTEFPLPAPSDSSQSIVSGPGEALWITGSQQRIWRVTVDGTFSQFSVPFSIGSPTGIAVGSDGNLWFTGFPNGLGYITPAGALTEVPLPLPPILSLDIAAGSDGNLWLTGGSIRRVTPAGAITDFALPGGTFPEWITAGSDGNIWFTSDARTICGICPPNPPPEPDSIGRITRSGVVSLYLIPSRNPGPAGIVTGPDGALWFTEAGGNKIGRFVPPPGFLAPQDVPVLDIRGTVLFVILLGLAGLFLLRRVS